jgi:uncharacterized protein YifE (UPF0438 family)
MKKHILSPALLIATFILGASIIATGSVFAGKDKGEYEIVRFELNKRLLNQEKEPRLLPTSPFYSLKEWGRKIRILFTFDSIKKSELEIKISDEKMAELVAVAEKEPQNKKAIEKAFENYQKARERLMQRLASLKETSQNPNVDRLLDKIVDQEIRHIEVFDRINKMRRRGFVVDISTGPELVAKKDSPEKFAERVKSAIEQLPSAEPKSLRGIEIIDRLFEGLTPEVAGELIKIRQEYSEKLVDEINKLTEKEGVKPEIVSTIKILPGDPVKHLMILEEIEQNANLRGIEKKDIRRGMVIAKPGVILSAKEALIEEMNSKQDIKQKAEEQIKKTEEAIGKLENYLNQFSNLPPRDKDKPFRTNQTEVNQTVVQTILEQAKDHLKKAKKAFEEEKYGEAFGLAVSAQSLAENGLRILLVFQVSSTVPPAQQVPSPVENPSRQACPTIAPACPLENCLKAGKEFEAKYPGCDYTSTCEKQCQIEECGPMPLYPTKEGCQRVCKNGKWQDICEPIKPIESRQIEVRSAEPQKLQEQLKLPGSELPRQ